MSNRVLQVLKEAHTRKERQQEEVQKQVLESQLKLVRNISKLEKLRKHLKTEITEKNEQKQLTTRQALIAFKERQQQVRDAFEDKDRSLEEQLRLYKVKIQNDKVVKSERRKLKHEDSQRRLEFTQSSDLHQKQAILKKHLSIQSQIQAIEKQKQ